MQQTEQYKFNKPGVDDPIAIAPLNENMDKVEAALSAEAAARAAGDAALDQRVTVLEAHKLFFGTYKGTGAYNTQTFQLGVTPKAVIVTRDQVATNENCCLSILGSTMTDGSHGIYVQIIENGFKVSYHTNDSTSTYYYMAVC